MAPPAPPSASAPRAPVTTIPETKSYKAQTFIEDLMFKLNFSASWSNEVKNMIGTITEGEYGQGVWFRVFIAA